MGRFLGHFGHPDGVARAVEAVESGAPGIELVAKHKNETAGHGGNDEGVRPGRG
jgi:hypothetical protein